MLSRVGIQTAVSTLKKEEFGSFKPGQGSQEALVSPQELRPSTIVQASDSTPSAVCTMRIRLRERRLSLFREAAGRLLEAGEVTAAQRVLIFLKAVEHVEYLTPKSDSRWLKAIRSSRRPVVRNRESTNDLPWNLASYHPQGGSVEGDTDWETRFDEFADQVTVIGAECDTLTSRMHMLTPSEMRRLQTLEADLPLVAKQFAQFLDRLVADPRIGSNDWRVVQLRESEALMSDLRDMGKGAVALITLVTSRSTWIVIVTPTTRKAVEVLISQFDLEKRVRALRDAVGDPKSDPLFWCRDVYRLLVSPIEADLRVAEARTLLWSLDGILRYLPVSALHDGEHYLVEKYQNVTFTMASLARLKDAPRPRWRGVGLGVSKSIGNAPALPGVIDELNGIFVTEPGDASGTIDGSVRLDEAFVESTLSSAEIRPYQLVHIATHFGLDPKSPATSGLLLGDGSLLSLATISDWPPFLAGVDLLTLSACGTAVGFGGGREVDALAIIAQRKGAKSVVASLLRVHDGSTSVLMAEFYRCRERGSVTKIEALRRAQLVLLAGNPSTQDTASQRDRDLGLLPAEKPVAQPKSKRDFSHPCYWAAFVLIGNWL